MFEQMVNLHAHNHFSPLDGFCTPEEAAFRAKEIGMSALATTEHGTLAGHRDFQRACKKAGIKPILGEELYYSETDRYDRRAKASRQDGTSVYVHLIALAMNEQGQKNLQTIDREAWLSFYHKPRMDWEILEKYNEDIIFTSACMGGLLAKAIERKDLDYAYEQAKRFKDLLGDRYYIEIQGHNPRQLNLDLLQLADTLNIKPVIAEDSHYAGPDQKELEEIFLILSTHPKKSKDASVDIAQKMPMLERLNYLYPDRPMSFQNINLYIGGYELRRKELLGQGIDRLDVFENTLEIADRIGEYSYMSDLDTLPKVCDDPDEMLRQKTKDGLIRLGLFDKEEYRARAQHELDIIISKRFSNYFLILEDALVFARKQGIRSGKGRGSGASSLVNYSLGITGIDPLEHHLLFERFLDPERSDWPDVDWDIQDSRRDEIRIYLTKKYGHVANITNINTYKGKKAIKDAARALGVPYGQVNKAMKAVEGFDDNAGNIVIDEFKRSAKEFCSKYPDAIKIAEELYGRINGYGMHAAGVVITKQPIADYAPIETRKAPGSDERVEVVGLDKNECESVGLIKIDLLGLKTLTVVDDAIRIIKENKGILVDIDSVPMDEAPVYRMLAEGRTLGVFQCDAAPYTKLLMRMGCADFNDLVVSNALVRPGAWNAVGEDYLKAKKNPRNAVHILDDVSYFMDETYGYPVYQEQMMKLSVELAGFTVPEANVLRKGIGKKKRDIIDKFKPKFIDGAATKVDRAMAEKLWISFEESGAYAFVKSHAVAYSILSYQTAWLKYHYPLEFMCALLMNEDKKEKITDCMLECKRMGIKILLPHINHSAVHFAIEGESLRMGLSSVKFISDKLANRIISNRPYENYAKFKEYVSSKYSGLNVRILSSLNAFGGATFDDNPRNEDYKKHMYDVLGIPAFETKLVTSAMMEEVRPLEEYDDSETFIAFGVVKGIKRGDGWARIDIVDSTGTAGVFADQDINIIKGKMYILLIGNNRIMKFIDLDEDSDASEDVIMEFLRNKKYTDGIPDGQYKILHAQASLTKAGKNIARLVVCDNERTLYSITCFDKLFNYARAMCKIGAVRILQIGTYKGSLVLNGVS